MDFIKLSITLVLLLLLSSVVLSAECNYFSIFNPVDVCLPVTSTFDRIYYCNGTDIIVNEDYTTGECGMDGTTPTWYVSYDTSTFGGNCMADKNCDYSIQICDDVLRFSYVVDLCYSFGGSSIKYSCSSSEPSVLTTTGWDGDDCTGSQSGTVTYDLVDDEEFYGYTNCEYICTGNGAPTDEPTDQPTDEPTVQPTQSPTCPELDCPICQTDSGDSNNAKQNSNSNNNNNNNNNDGLSETVINLIVICVVCSVVLIVYGILYFLQQQSKDKIEKEIELKKLELLGMDMDFNSNYNNNDIITNNNNNNNSGLEMTSISGVSRPVYNDIGNNRNDKLPKKEIDILKVKSTSVGDGNGDLIITGNDGGENGENGENNISYVNPGVTPGK